MGINAQMKRGLARLVAVDADTGTITRRAMIDNGMGGLIPDPDAEPETHAVTCRVSYESGGIWRAGAWEAGSKLDTTPFVLADAAADIRENDRLEWRGKAYTVGPVTRPSLGGGIVCTQARLVEVKT